MNLKESSERVIINNIWSSKVINLKFVHLDKLITGQCHKYREYDNTPIVASFGDSRTLLFWSEFPIPKIINANNRVDINVKFREYDVFIVKTNINGIKKAFTGIRFANFF